MIAGLLVLTVLLFAGAQASTAMLPNAHHRGAYVASQLIGAANYGATAPARDDDCDHGLPCCLGGQCVTNAYWIPAKTANLPRLSKVGVVGWPGRVRSLSGIATQPLSPPPRAAA